MKPYTYCIRHLPSGKRYYGVRYARNCDPADLWESYFTSSKYIADLIEADGKEAFTTEIRKTFETVEKAVAWEQRVLRRLKILEGNDNWLNRNVGGGLYLKRRPLSVETKEKMRLAKLNRPSNNKGKACPEAAKQAKSEKMKGRAKPSSMRSKLSETRRGSKRVYREDGSYFMVFSERIDC